MRTIFSGREVSQLDRTGKAEILQDLTARFSNAKSLTFSEYKGLSVKEVNALRRECRKAGLEYVVAKNTLILLALPEELRAKTKTHLAGTTSVTVDCDEGVNGPKVLMKFAKDHPFLKPKAGIIENQVLNAAQVDALSKTPGREELLSRMLGSIQAPAQNILGCVNGVSTKLAGLLKSYCDKLEQAAA
jgi:large subunit ribosomal protein L10